MRLLSTAAVPTAFAVPSFQRRVAVGRGARVAKFAARPVHCDALPPGTGTATYNSPPGVGRSTAVPRVPSVRPKSKSVPNLSPSSPSGQEPGLAFGTPRVGTAEPLGASLTQDGGINFAVFSSGATAVSLCLFHESDLYNGRVSYEIKLDPHANRTGDVWHVRLDSSAKSLLYGYRLDGNHEEGVPATALHPEAYYGHRYNKDKVVVDPYATMVVGRRKYGELGPDLDYTNPSVLGLASTWVQEAAAMPFRDNFDWEGDKPLGLPMKDLVIYEMHVRGFTADASSSVPQPGTYAALTQKMDYLAGLGVNALELLPIQAFNELEYYEIKPGSAPRFNFWGYSTCHFLSPMTRYSAAAAQGGGAADVAAELKTFVKEAHRRGMEVILDVVFNHTAEGNEMGPSISFRGLDNRVYYMLAPEGQYYNYSGCGNTFNCNHPVARRFILDTLRFWVTEYHVDGFRFDLASILTRAHSAWQQGTRVDDGGDAVAAFSGDGGSGGAVTMGEEGVMSNGGGVPTGTPLADPPLIEEISMDPVLANTKLIAEAWDCDGLNQVGGFPHYGGRWAEWNGSFRDTVRQFMKGTDGPWVGAFAEALCGSPETYGKSEPKEDNWWGCNAGRKWMGGRLPQHSVNFITAHDGFTLADLVAYNDKHNEANGEGNNDGEQHNLSWNCGAEGATDDTHVLRMRQRQMRNLMTALLVAQGVPMILMGDEYGHSKGGNNNTYCHDDPLNWHDWAAAESDAAGLRRFVSSLTKFRHSRTELGLPHFPDGRIISWHGEKADEPDWSDTSRMLAFTLAADPDCNWQARGLYIAWNASHLPVTVDLPKWAGSKWVAVADTAKPAPYDFLAADDKLSAAEVRGAQSAMSMWTDDALYPMLPRSCIILESVPLGEQAGPAVTATTAGEAQRRAASPPPPPSTPPPSSPTPQAFEFSAPPAAQQQGGYWNAPPPPPAWQAEGRGEGGYGRGEPAWRRESESYRQQQQSPAQSAPPAYDPEVQRMMDENRRLKEEAQRRGLM